MHAFALTGAVTVAFPVEGEDFSLLAWTTTPWTLPSNLALCVNPEYEYTVFEGEFPNNPKHKGKFCVVSTRLFGKGALYKEQDKGYTVIKAVDVDHRSRTHTHRRCAARSCWASGTPHCSTTLPTARTPLLSWATRM